MAFFKKFKERSTEEEIIDDFNLAGEEVVKTFQTIERVNSLLGGNKTFVDGVRKMINISKLFRKKAPIVVCDLGCGSADGLRSLAKWGQNNKASLTLIGFDANAFIVKYASQQAVPYPSIQIKHQDIFDPKFSLDGTDLVTFNLCLHHFSATQNKWLLDKCRSEGVKAVLINDLHRHWLAYFLFGIFCRFTFANDIARKDGLLSILKGFKKHELRDLFNSEKDISMQLQWKWAFRYQMIINLNS